MKKQGFTLIELLVVIAIIGILSAVVLASLNTARDKGSDAAIMADLDGARTQAAIFYETDKTYAGLCANETIANQVAAAENANGTVKNAVCAVSDGTKFAIAAELIGDDGNTYCVDNTGFATTSAKALATIETDEYCTATVVP